MHEHEFELIAALAEGRLEDESQARALVASDPRYREEYEAQKTAFEALSAVGTASLSDAERAGLHRDIWTELRASTAPTPTRQPWYIRWSPVAAGMLVVVGLVAVLNQGGSSDSGGEIAADLLSASTTLADSTESAGAGEGTGEDDSASDEEGASDGGDLGTADIARVLPPAAEQFYAEEAAQIRTGAESAAAPLQGDSADRLQECVDETGLEGYVVLASHPSPVAQSDEEDVPEAVIPYIAAAPVGADLSTDPIAFVDLFACELIYLHD
jgi:hypothetical protein